MELAEIVELWVVRVVGGPLSLGHSSVVWLSVQILQGRIIEVLARGLVLFGGTSFDS